MGREVRRVPRDWQHPVDEDGHYIGLMSGAYEDAAYEYEVGAAAWECGWIAYVVEGPWMRRSESKSAPLCASFDAWHGERPRPDQYMPAWPEEQCAHFMMYETTSEGTPISPAFETPEALARWLADNNASAFGDMTATYEEWLATCQRGWAPSALVLGGGPMVSGVAGLAAKGTP